MTRKDYIAVSNILKEYRQSIEATDYDDLVDDFAKYFAYDNPRFDITKFREACKANFVNGTKSYASWRG